MLNHIVMMKFKPEVTPDDVNVLEKRLNDLPNHIVEIQSYEFGRDVVRSGRSFDFALVSLFANPEALQRYQVHPQHQTVVELLKKMCDQIITVDFYGSDLSDLKDVPPPEMQDILTQ